MKKEITVALLVPIKSPHSECSTHIISKNCTGMAALHSREGIIRELLFHSIEVKPLVPHHILVFCLCQGLNT